jgi:D-amino peptidase
MKVYISADMEGTSGIVHSAQTGPEGIDYGRGRGWMMGEVNAAIAGAFEGGAESVVVCDGHGANGNRNLRLDEIDERAELITGRPRPMGQMEGLDASFAVVLFTGYHTRHGSAGVLSHTTNGQAVANLWINGSLVGEFGLNTYLAGHFGVPVAMISGDDLTIAEAQAFAPHVEGVVVKQAFGRYAARCVHPTRAQAAIKAGATRAVKKAPSLQPLRPSAPVEVTLQFKDTGGAESARRVPGVEMLKPDTIRMRYESMPEAYQAYNAMVGLWPVVWGNWIKG